MKDDDGTLQDVFTPYVDPAVLKNLQPTALLQISKRLGSSGLIDSFHRDVVFLTTVERVEANFRKTGARHVRSFPSYFLTSCRHEASRYVWRETRFKTVELEALDSLRELQRSLDAEIELPFASLSDEENAVKITQRALSSLPERDRLLIRAHLSGCRKEAELAQQFRLSISALRVASCRSLKKLKEAVSHEVESEILILSERPPTSPTPRRDGAE